MAEIPNGDYDAKCTDVQFNEKGNLELIVRAMIQTPEGVPLGEMTSWLYFSQKSAHISFEKLQAMGWKGTSPSDLATLSVAQLPATFRGRVYEDTYQGKTSKRFDILSGGGGRIVASNPVDPKAFAARVAALVGNSFGPAASGNAGLPAVKPPF